MTSEDFAPGYTPARASPALRRRSEPIACADHGHRRPGLAGGRRDAPLVQDARNLAGGLLSQLIEYRRQRTRCASRLTLNNELIDPVPAGRDHRCSRRSSQSGCRPQNLSRLCDLNPRLEKLTMKVSTITLATALALSSAGAMAQSSRNSLDEMAASSATRSAVNSMQRSYYHQGWSSDRYNGYGINSLGVTTNQGRMYNGG
jgi:hypothetical protein